MSYNPAEIHDEFDPAKHYARILRRDAADSYLTGQDENEADSMMLRQITNLGQVVLVDGTVLSGADITVDVNTGETAVEAGKIAAFGLVREPAGASLTVPTTGELTVGIWIETRIVDETDDADLIFNPPGTSFPASGSAMSPREQQLARWGLSTEVNIDTSDVTFAYVAVYRIKDGVVIRPLPGRGAWADDLERYDREAHGSYTVAGMQVTALGKTGSDQVFSISAGTVNAWGRKIDRAYDTRHVQVEAPPIRIVQGEHHAYVDSAGSMVIPVRNTPVSSVQRVEVLKERTVALTKGIANSLDTLPDASIDSLISVTQGATTYVATTDYVLLADKVSWAPGGSEPSPGSTYSVTYRYYAVIAPTSFTATTITVAGAVNGSQVTLDYSYKVRRIDAISIEANGDVVYTLGPVNYLAPEPPTASSQALTLAHVDNDWINTPVVTNVAAPAVSFARQAMESASIEDLRSVVSRLALQVALGSDQASARDRQFVDAMTDDSQRDLGISQTAAIAGGVLRLPIAVSVQNLTIAAPVIPARTYTRVRTLETSDGSFTLSSAQKLGVMTIAEKYDPRLTGQGVLAPDTLLLARTVTPPDGPVIGARTQLGALGASARFKVQTLHATVTGVAPAATLSTLTFNDQTVTPTGGVADGAGVSAFTFDVPAGEPLGGKRIIATYSDGTRAGVIWGFYSHQRPDNQSTHIRFKVPALGEWIGRIQFQVHDVGGTEPIYWAISEGEGNPDIPFRNDGVPLAEGLIPMTGVSDGDWITITPPPMFGRDQAIRVHLSSASPHKLKTAPANDTAYGSSQSSGRTLVHRIDAATMGQAVTTVSLGTVAVTGITDIAIAAETWGAASFDQWSPDVTFTLVFGGETYVLEANKSTIPLAAPYTGNIAISANVASRARYGSKAGVLSFLWPRVQLVTGIIQTAGTYISQAQTAMAAQSLSVFFTALKDPDATITVDVQESGGGWTAMTQAAAVPLGNNWFDFRFNKAAFTSTAPRIRITLGGDVAKRVYLDNVRSASY